MRKLILDLVKSGWPMVNIGISVVRRVPFRVTIFDKNNTIYIVCLRFL